MINKVMLSTPNTQNILSFKKRGQHQQQSNNLTTSPEYARAIQAYTDAFTKKNVNSKFLISKDELAQKTMQIQDYATQLFCDALNLRGEAQEKIKSVNKVYAQCKNNEIDDSVAALSRGDSETSEILEEYDYPSCRTSRQSIFRNGKLKGLIEYNKDGTTSTIAIQDDGYHMLYKTPEKSIYANADGSILNEEKFEYKVYGDSDKEVTYTHANPIYGRVEYTIHDKNTNTTEQGSLRNGYTIKYIKSTKTENGEAIQEHIEMDEENPLNLIFYFKNK